MTCLVSPALPGLGCVLLSLGRYGTSRDAGAEGTGLAGLRLCLHAPLPPSLPQSPQRPPLSPDLEDPLRESSSPGGLRPGTVVPWHSVLRAAIPQGRCGRPSGSPWSRLILPGPGRGRGRSRPADLRHLAWAYRASWGPSRIHTEVCPFPHLVVFSLVRCLASEKVT